MKYLVYIKEHGQWVECGEGRLTQKQATRIAREIRAETGVATKVCPA